MQLKTQLPTERTSNSKVSVWERAYYFLAANLKSKQHSQKFRRLDSTALRAV